MSGGNIERRIVRPLEGDDYLDACTGEERRVWLEARALIADRLADLDFKQVSAETVEILTALFITYQVKVNGGHNEGALDEFLQFCETVGGGLQLKGDNP